jgi:hypothetical protein
MATHPKRRMNCWAILGVAGRRQDKLFYRSHPKDGSAFVSSVTSQNPTYAQWQSDASARYRARMKVNGPTVVALVLWFLFFASHAFAVFKSPYPTKAEWPDQIIVVGEGSVGPSAMT